MAEHTRGSQAIKTIKPKSLIEAASANSLMRLMPMEDGTVPLDKYQRNKQDISLWYKEMSLYGLLQEEIEVLEKYYLDEYGVPSTQEHLMRILMDEKICGFTLIESNFARKVVAKFLAF